MTIFLIGFSFIFGSILGSFLNVVTLRLPNAQSLGGRSHCAYCKHALGFLDLFPIFSFLLLLGKCRYCQHSISKRYFIVEFVTGLLFALSTWYVNPVTAVDFILLGKYFLVVAALLVVFIVDLEHFIILDSVLITSSIFAVIINLALDILTKQSLGFNSNFIGGIIAALAGSLPFFGIWYFSDGKWMGFGDVKLMLLLGLLLGIPNILVGLMVSILLGGVVSTFLLAFTSKTLKTRIPFGTFLSLGTITAFVYGDKLLKWYLSFLRF